MPVSRPTCWRIWHPYKVTLEVRNENAILLPDRIVGYLRRGRIVVDDLRQKLFRLALQRTHRNHLEEHQTPRAVVDLSDSRTRRYGDNSPGARRDHVCDRHL